MQRFQILDYNNWAPPKESSLESFTPMDGIFLAHISDLHFGASLNPVVYQKLPTAIMHALASIGPTIREYNLVVSGDITQCGASYQFTLAQSLIRSRMRFGRSPADSTGFDLRSNFVAMVPGNHDQWGGRDWLRPSPISPAGYDEKIMGSQFRKTPWVKNWNSPCNRLQMQIIGVNSNSGVRGTNALARGVISDVEFNKLRERLETLPVVTDRHVARAIVTHHNLFSPADWRTRFLELKKNHLLPSAWPMDDDSRERLLQIAAENDVQIIFTGHTHRFNKADLRPQSFHRPIFGDFRVVRELRCATTLKGGELEFIIHRIYLTNDDVRWAYWRFTWDMRQGMFIRDRREPDEDFPIRATTPLGAVR
jgi:hypothetical protein